MIFADIYGRRASSSGSAEMFQLFVSWDDMLVEFPLPLVEEGDGGWQVLS